ATDMVTGEEMVFHNGNLPTAIRASMSIPGLFTPVLLDDMVLVDGGILNNVPIDVCKAMGADIIITSMVGTKIRNDKSKLNSVIGIARNMLGVVTRKTNQQNIDQTDIYIEPDLAGVGMLNFDAESIDLMVRNGYASASEKRSEIEQVANLLKRWGDHSFQLQNEKAHYTDEQQYEINEVIITGVSEKDKEWLMRKSGLLWKKTISGLEMEEAIAIMYGTNFFDKVSYSIVNVPGTNKADIIMNYVFRKPHSVGLSFRIDSQEAASIGIMAGLNTHRMTAPKLEISAKLGYNPHATILASYSHRWMPKLNISASIRKSETDLNNFGKPYSHYKYIQQHHKIYFSEAYTRGWGIKAGIDFEQLIFSQSFTLTDYEALNPGYVGDPFLGAFAALNVDTRDNVQFPSKGVWMEFSGSWRFHDFKHPQGFNGFGDVVMKFKGYIPMGERFVLVPQFYSRSLIGNGYDQFNDLYDSPYENYMGGLLVGRYVEHQLPFIGINKPEVMYPNLGIFMGEGRVHIAGKHYVSVVASYAKESNTFMNMFKSPVIITDDDVDSMTSYHWWGAGLRYSLQLPVGPFLIDVAYSNNTKKVGVYASIGLDF
ncbi:MAG: patatin-like phospholipase family protein, partial [Bacteroidales bacterium]|nr:patatin-like phospholipase family protein [Bacteroidales bacterium]